YSSIPGLDQHGDNCDKQLHISPRRKSDAGRTAGVRPQMACRDIRVRRIVHLVAACRLVGTRPATVLYVQKSVRGIFLHTDDRSLDPRTWRHHRARRGHASDLVSDAEWKGYRPSKRPCTHDRLVLAPDGRIMGS